MIGQSSIFLKEFVVCSYLCSLLYSCLGTLGIAVTGASDISTDLVSSNQHTDYSYIPHNVMLDPHKAILRCATGLGPSGSDNNTVLGGWYFNGSQIPIGSNCNGPVFEVRGATVMNNPGVISLYLCGTFTTTEEGVYSCIMMNSSMMEENMRVAVYFSGRSELLDNNQICTPFQEVLSLSAQLLQ